MRVDPGAGFEGFTKIIVDEVLELEGVVLVEIVCGTFECVEAPDFGD